MKYFHILFTLFIACFSCQALASARDDDEDINPGTCGLALYTSGNYQEASPYLRQALESGQNNYAYYYYQICRGNLDGQEHSPEETADAFIRSVYAGNADLTAYLATELPEAFGKEAPEIKKLLIAKWAHDRQEPDTCSSSSASCVTEERVESLYTDCPDLDKDADEVIKAALEGDEDAIEELESFDIDDVRGMDPDLIKRILIEQWEADRKDKSTSSSSSSPSEDYRDVFEDYIQGRYERAAPRLKDAALKRHPLALQYYADICRRGLDSQPHTYKEAAMYYILAALSGNTDILSWLKSIDERLITEADPEKRMNLLVRHWELDEFLSQYKQAQPITINSFLTSMGLEIGKVMYQKVPYFFHMTLSSLSYRPLADPSSEYPSEGDWDAVPSLPATCRDTVMRKLPNSTSFAPWQYGIVCPGTYDTMDRYFAGKETLPPQSPPRLEAFQRFMAKSVGKFIQTKSAGELSRISHYNIPWILAGLKYLARDDYRHHSIWDLKEDSRKRLSKEDLEAILSLVENKDIWPNERAGETVEKFRQDLRNEFFAERLVYSTESNELVSFFMEQARSLKIDLDQKEDTETIKEGFIMQFCEALELRNIKSTKTCFDVLDHTCRHLNFLRTLSLHFHDSFGKRDKVHARKIKAIFSFLEYRGVSVTGLDEGD